MKPPAPVTRTRVCELGLVMGSLRWSTPNWTNGYPLTITGVPETMKPLLAKGLRSSRLVTDVRPPTERRPVARIHCTFHRLAASGFWCVGDDFLCKARANEVRLARPECDRVHSASRTRRPSRQRPSLHPSTPRPMEIPRRTD